MALLTLLFKTFTLLPLVALTYFFFKAIYNLTFHPLAKFPGPKIAGATRLWEHYYAWFYNGGGHFDTVLNSLHAQSGPIVRINPFEVHISDRDMYDEIYNFSPQLDKRAYFASANLQNSPSFAMHSRIRKVFNPYFSKTSITRVEPLIREMVEKLCDKIKEAGEANAVAKLSTLFRSLTFDVVCKYSIADDFGLLDDPQRAEVMVQGFFGAFKIFSLIQQVPVVAIGIALLESLPKSLQPPSTPGMDYIRLWQEHLAPKIQKLRSTAPDQQEKRSHPALFADYLHDPAVPASEKTDQRIRENVELFVGAGMETTGYALSMAMFQLLTHRPHLQKLRAELHPIWPEDGTIPSWRTLEQLPFLTAVLKESLRMSVGVMSHLHRVNHQRPMQYKEWIIPPGTSVSMSQVRILYDEDIYPEPERFVPERWMQGEKSKEGEKWLVVFSKGARVCIGAQLAWAELYLTLATVVHRFDLDLFQTDERDIVPTRGFFVPFPEREDGVRAMVEKCVA